MVKGKCTKEIFWNGQSYPAGSIIECSPRDMSILASAGVAVSVGEVETEMETPSENRAKGRRR